MVGHVVYFGDNLLSEKVICASQDAFQQNRWWNTFHLSFVGKRELPHSEPTLQAKEAIRTVEPT